MKSGGRQSAHNTETQRFATWGCARRSKGSARRRLFRTRTFQICMRK